MELPRKHPISLAVAFALIRAAARIVPKSARDAFQYDWNQKCLQRWQFLHETGLWDVREATQLVGVAVGVVPDALQHFGSQEAVQTRVSRFFQSPLTCLLSLTGLLTAIAVFSGGLPATRDVFFKRVDLDHSRLVYVWVHNIRGGGDRPLPADVVQAWRKNSQLVSSAAAFRAMHRDVRMEGGKSRHAFVVTTEASFFKVMGVRLKALPADSTTLLLSYDAWLQFFHASPKVLGVNMTVANQTYPVAGILPAGFEPLSKQPAIYLVQSRYTEDDAYAAVRLNPGVTQPALDRDFCEIAQSVTYYFLNGQIRYGFAQTAVWAPVRSFGVGAVASLLMLIMVLRVNWKALWPRKAKKAWLRRSAFFAAKTTLALACVFTGCLEWSRSNSSILFGNFDPATGPFLLWLYILGTMGVFFWAAVDQKMRCRECLQFLAFPVRMGSPGTMLLDWSGTELCCSDGHGVLHVPHLAPSWAEESDHWIALDDSWRTVFGPNKRD